jgi:UPF0176 acylphosphatase like domain
VATRRVGCCRRCAVTAASAQPAPAVRASARPCGVCLSLRSRVFPIEVCSTELAASGLAITTATSGSYEEVLSFGAGSSPTKAPLRCQAAQDGSAVAEGRPRSDQPACPSHSVVNFYHLTDVPNPGELAKLHKDYIQAKEWDICGRIYLSFQGINAQFSGPVHATRAYTAWVASHDCFQGLQWREYPVPRNVFPRLRVKFRPNLISLQGGMSDLPVTGLLLCAHAGCPTCRWRSR